MVQFLVGIKICINIHMRLILPFESAPALIYHQPFGGKESNLVITIK